MQSVLTKRKASRSAGYAAGLPQCSASSLHFSDAGDGQALLRRDEQMPAARPAEIPRPRRNIDD